MSDTKLHLLSFTGKIRTLHLTWVAFFVSFIVWFAHALLMPFIREALPARAFQRLRPTPLHRGGFGPRGCTSRHAQGTGGIVPSQRLCSEMRYPSQKRSAEARMIDPHAGIEH